MSRPAHFGRSVLGFSDAITDPDPFESDCEIHFLLQISERKFGIFQSHLFSRLGGFYSTILNSGSGNGRLTVKYMFMFEQNIVVSE